MAKADEQKIQEMIEAARQCEARGEHAQALDYYEELQTRGLARTEHLAAMGSCYMQTRQRQDAKRVWLGAFEKDPSNQLIIDLLDRNFKGWERTVSGRGRQSDGHGSETSVSPPPPPPADPAQAARGGLSLSFEAVSPPSRPEPAEETRFSQQGRPSQPSRPIPDVFVQPSPAGSQQQQRQQPQPHQRGGGQPQQQQPQMRPAHNTSGGSSSPVNWDFVLADSMAESGRR